MAKKKNGLEWLTKAAARDTVRRLGQGKRPRYPFPESKDEARRWLVEIASRLRGLSFPTSPFRDKQARYLYGAIRAHLFGGISLDIALGLRPGKKPLQTTRHEKIARKIHALRQAGESWKSIARKIPHNTRTLRSIYSAHELLFVQEEILRRLREKDQDRASDPAANRARLLNLRTQRQK